MSNHLYKYPRTPHLPWSEGVSENDKKLTNIEHLLGKEVIITEKIDGENCLAGSSLIETEEGLRTIEDICLYGCQSRVRSFNTATKRCEWCTIEGTKINNPTKDWIIIETEDGQVLITTPDHYIWLPELKCYRQAKDLRKEDALLIS